MSSKQRNNRQHDNNKKEDDVILESFSRAGKNLSFEAPDHLDDAIMYAVKQKQAEMSGQKNTDRDKESVFARIFQIPAPVFAVAAVFIILLALFSVKLVQNKQDSQIHTNAKTKQYTVVTFRLEYPEAENVSLVGTFNQWQKGKDKLERENGHWILKKKLEKGSYYEYAFVINENKIVNDPKAQKHVEDGFGGKSAVVFAN